MCELKFVETNKEKDSFLLSFFYTIKETGKYLT